MALGFIRYFATTDDSAIGKVALGYLTSLLRIAPVRVVSKSGQLEGAWRRFEQLITTPMIGTCVSCVCTPAAQWVWEASVPMPATDAGAQGAASAPSAPAIAGTAKGILELYTPYSGSGARAARMRNVLFVAEAPTTDAQRQTALRYEAVVYLDSRFVIAKNAEHGLGTILAHVPQPVTDHGTIRNAVLGLSGPSAPAEGPYR